MTVYVIVLTPHVLSFFYNWVFDTCFMIATNLHGQRNIDFNTNVLSMKRLVLVS